MAMALVSREEGREGGSRWRRWKKSHLPSSFSPSLPPSLPPSLVRRQCLDGRLAVPCELARAHDEDGRVLTYHCQGWEGREEEREKGKEGGSTG